MSKRTGVAAIVSFVVCAFPLLGGAAQEAPAAEPAASHAKCIKKGKQCGGAVSCCPGLFCSWVDSAKDNVCH